MQRAYNFGAGPAMLPNSVLEQVHNDLFDWRGTGVSVMEIGHRTPIFQELIKDLQKKLQQIMNIPANYEILFVPGGGQGQFSAIPMNLGGINSNFDYLLSGIWSERAFNCALQYGSPRAAALRLKNSITSRDMWDLNDKAAYVYYCPNETIDGIQFDHIPDTGNIPLIADITSSVLSQPLDVERFGLLFAAAQKNLGIAGVTLVIVRNDLMEQAQSIVPNVWNYKMLSLANSTVNTVTTFALYVMDLVLDWINTQGGLSVLGEINQHKAQKLYSYIDASGFYTNPVDNKFRSQINVPFELSREELLDCFLSEAGQCGLKYLKGHKIVGGARASLYNAMPESGVDALIEFMQDFANRNS
jgi:phosphoserine aminotransferase